MINANRKSELELRRTLPKRFGGESDCKFIVRQIHREKEKRNHQSAKRLQKAAKCVVLELLPRNPYGKTGNKLKTWVIALITMFIVFVRFRLTLVKKNRQKQGAEKERIFITESRETIG